ncbi:hypothetical protein KC19_8G033700 [Ceratodon purpureus]|uniref:Secreted protein n=1 Tax=Ceratodon purpureus TaxID=3225 RepID=A0A8T0H099_CERPU|nr:hypothetical protein KC19_8G033700 [Ceratodon purpureus]
MCLGCCCFALKVYLSFVTISQVRVTTPPYSLKNSQFIFPNPIVFMYNSVLENFAYVGSYETVRCICCSLSQKEGSSIDSS